MRGWTVGMVLVGALMGTGAQGFQPYVPEEEPELVALRERLAAHEATLARLEEEQALYEEAERLGVVSAVESSRLPEHQQRRLAVKIVRESRRNGLDPMLVVAVILCESSFNNYAVSHVGAMGLMQVMPDTGVYLADKAGMKLGRTSNLFDSELNVELGTSYLADLIQRFGSVEKALVAYNAGPGLAKRILAQPGPRERFMAGYPAKVMREFRRLKAWQARELTQQAPNRKVPGGQG
jgi:soluble lytic murein transglycosylase